MESYVLLSIKVDGCPSKALNEAIDLVVDLEEQGYDKGSINIINTIPALN
jgi:hypothetical protein